MHTNGDQAMVAAPSTGSSPTPRAAPKRPLPHSALDLIGATMTSAFGTKWTTTHGDNFADTSGRIWAIQLAGLSGAQIQRGLTHAVREAWPPTLSDFKAMCLGVLPLATVEMQREYGEPKDQQPFTLLVGRYIPYDQWRMADPQRRERLLAKAYEQAKEHLLQGGALPEYTPASQQITLEDERPAPPPIMVTAEEAIAEARKLLGIKPPAPPEPLPPIPERPAPETCARCKGTRKDPDPTLRHPGQQTPGECVACFGSGNEAAFNRVVLPDGTILERIP